MSATPLKASLGATVNLLFGPVYEVSWSSTGCSDGVVLSVVDYYRLSLK